MVSFSRRATSTKTRIETGYAIKEDVKENSRRATSTKTRIETVVATEDKVVLDVEEQHPLKQGLKLQTFLTPGIYRDHGRRATSTKTRIETPITDRHLLFIDSLSKSNIH